MHLNPQGFCYLQTQRKGVLTFIDMKETEFQRKIHRDYAADMWTKQVAFYVDCVSYA